MPGATHNPTISVPVTLAPAGRQVAGFGTTLLLVDIATNTLDGDRMRTWTSYADAEADRTAGYISASTLAAANVAFSVSPKPDEFKVGYVDTVTSVAATKAFKAFGGAGLGDGLDTVIEAHTAGLAGNYIAVELVGDSAGAVSITNSVIGDYTYVVIHYQPGVSTVTNVESAITALSGANDLIDVKTAGTGATVLDADAGEMSPVLLVGGVAAVAVETYSTALTACIAYDDDFYGVCIDSRVAATITAFGATIEAAAKKMLFCAQNSSSSWLDSGLPSGITGARERTIFVYHSTDAQWLDVALMVNRLIADPDVLSSTWNCEIVGVTAYTTTLTAAERLLAIANYCNLMLPFYSATYWLDPGINSNNRPVYEIVSADWFATRLAERVAALKIRLAGMRQKLPVTPVGQTMVLSVIRKLYAQAIAAGHIVQPDEDDDPIVAETITDADRTARQLRFLVRAQIGVDARVFEFPCYFSTDALSA